ncbi:MAG: hydroxymethylglutaryl-CoA lyase [Stappiaceae bacterium]
MNQFVTLYEMAPRDGLQNEKQHIPTDSKIKLVDLISECAFKKVEVTSFVSPKWVPQLADATEVMAGIKRMPGISYGALTPNLKGLDRALEAAADEVGIFGAASETFSQKNINCSIDESLERFRPVVEKASAHNVPVRGYISCITQCPYEGPIPPESVLRVVRALSSMGVYEISLGDTIGAGTPETIGAMLDVILGEFPAHMLAGHYHDTENRALENVDISLEKGLRTFDAAIGGLGGCPYAPGAKGNVDTLKVNALLHARGFETGLDSTGLERVADYVVELKGQVE